MPRPGSPLRRAMRQEWHSTPTIWNRSATRCVQQGMTENERQRIAELHVDSDPVVLAQLRRDPEIASFLDQLDLAVWELQMLRDRGNP